MGAGMEELRKEILQKMQELLTKEQMDKLGSVLDIVLHRYSVEPKREELTVYDDNNEAKLRRFIATKRLEGLSESTLEQYHRTVINMFETVGKPLEMIDTDDIRYYMAMYQEQRHVSKGTINNMRRYFSSFFGWCTDEDIIQKNPMRRIKSIKEQKTIKKPFSDTEMEKIRQAAGNIRNRALIEFLYSTGCRVSEVSAIDLEDIDFAHDSVVVNGKGNKQREVYISDKAMYWLDRYLSSRKDNNPALFIGKGCKRLNKPGIEALMRKLGKQAGVDKVHPHRFRRTIATNLINKGMPVQEVQHMLGHSKLDTTMIYCKVDSKNVQAAHRKYAA
jgi:site-specific recombinase XerD